MRSLPTFAAIFLAFAGLPGLVTAEDAIRPRLDAAGPEVGDAEPAVAGVAGRVLALTEPKSGSRGPRSVPLASVDVFAYDVTDSALHEVRTDAVGRFLFEELPAGMYKLVAFKAGFLPAAELLLRRRDGDHQFVELELAPRSEDEAPSSNDYWSVRGRIPADVLRQIDRSILAEEVKAGLQIDGTRLFRAEMWALSGSQLFGPDAPTATLRSAQVDVRGAVGTMKVGLDGTFHELAPSGPLDGFDGQVRQLAVHLEPNGHQRLRLATQSSQLLAPSLAPVDVERYRVDWTGRAGDLGETRVSASYEEEQNFHVGGGLHPIDIPGYSETWGLEGTFQGRLGEGTELFAGVNYRQRTLGLLGDLAVEEVPDESLDLFTTAESRLQPRVFLEYGLYSSVSDGGGLSVMPHGGVVVDLGDGWLAHGSMARRVEERDAIDPYRTFDSAYFAEERACRDAGDACYEVTLSRSEGDDEIAIGALHREFAETYRLYFSPDFFDRLESIFMVEGDQLPEVQLSLVRRLGPQVLARVESNVASGGGGIFYASDDASYRNQVRYLVTSVDTQFQRTSTGVFVAFHHLEQNLEPMRVETAAPPKVEMQRLQVMLTQDLDVLLDLATRWAVRLNMELSRGATPYALTADGELYKKLTGGFAVSF